MRFVIFFLVIPLCGRLEAVTETKIKYLPNGQVGGYEFILNNTAPAQKAGRSLAIKHANKILKTDSTFTRVDERVEGDNVFVNVQNFITKPEVKPRYPVSAILTVPIVRDNNGVQENVKLTFAKIGRYAALLVPIKNPGELAGLGNDQSIPPEIKNSIKAFIEVSDRPVSKHKYEFSIPPKIGAARAWSGVSRGGGSESRGSAFLGTNRSGPYEPPRSVNDNRDANIYAKYHNQSPRDRLQYSSYPSENVAGSQIGTVQTSKGLIITLSNKNLTLFAPIAERKVDSDRSMGSSAFYPYAPPVSSPKAHNIMGTTAQNNAPSVKTPRYHTFSLSEQPPNVSWSAKEYKGLQTDDGRSSLARGESRSGQTPPFSYSSAGHAVSGHSGTVVTGTEREQSPGTVLVDYPNNDLPAYRNPVALGGTEEFIASPPISNASGSTSTNEASTFNGSSQQFHHHLTQISQEVLNPNFDSSRVSDQSISLVFQQRANQNGLHKLPSPYDRYAKIFSSSEPSTSHVISTVEQRPSPAGPITGSRIATLEGIVSDPSTGNS